MRALTAAILRAFLADRVGAVLTLVAPVAFFTLFALFYRHMESADAFKFDVAVVDTARTADSQALVHALQESGAGTLRVRVCADVADVPANALAYVVVGKGFTRAAPRVSLHTRAPLPGAAEATRQLVESAVIRAFSAPTPGAQLTIHAQAGMLLRGSAAGFALIFVMFSASSIAGRGLGDDATGLVERMRSLGVPHATLTLARIAAMTVIACAQMAVTLVWAACVFGVMPSSVWALAVAAGLGAAACTSFVALVASAVGARARFAAVAPVVILVVSALSGSMIPRVLLPGAVARAGDWSFPAWAIDACTAAIDGRWDGAHLAMLAVWVVVCAAGAVLFKRGHA